MDEARKQQFVNVLIDTLTEDMGCEVFLGGSRRFGYSNYYSDWDLFVLLGPEMTLYRIRRTIPTLRTTSFIRYTGLSGAIGQASFMDRLAHITFYDLEVPFEELREEHDRLEAFLERYPGVLEQTRHKLANGSPIRGVTLYRNLLDQAHQSKNWAGRLNSIR